MHASYLQVLSLSGCLAAASAALLLIWLGCSGMCERSISPGDTGMSVSVCVTACADTGGLRLRVRSWRASGSRSLA